MPTVPRGVGNLASQKNTVVRAGARLVGIIYIHIYIYVTDIIAMHTTGTTAR
jgi:hypothetical protein